MALHRRLDNGRTPSVRFQDSPKVWSPPWPPERPTDTVHVSVKKEMEQTEARNRRSFLPKAFSQCPIPFLSSCTCKRKDEKDDKAANGQVGKEIGLIYGGSLIVNTLIGPGIFTSPKGVISGAGSVGLSLVIWATCGVFSTMAGLCFAELRESVKREGVEYAYITEAFGPLAGFVYCWMRIAAAEPVGTAVFALALSDYTVTAIFGSCPGPAALKKSIASLAVVSLALLNVFSQKLADRMQVLASVGKATALTIIILFGIKNIIDGKDANLRSGFNNTASNPTDITFAIYNSLWAYGGWSNVNHVTTGLRKPPRNLPRLVKTVIPLVMVIYVLVVTSYYTVMSRQQMMDSDAIGVTWATVVFVEARRTIIPIGVGLTALGSLNATFLSSGRLSGVAVKDHQMPEVASWLHVRSKTPILTVYLRMAIAIIMIVVADSSQLVRFFIFTVWLFHGMAVLALLVLRVKNKDKVRPYKVNLLLPVLVVLIIGFLLIGPFLSKPKEEFISSLVLIGLSLLCYLPVHWLYSRATLPDKFVIWLQLFFRIAPKRILARYERRRSSLANLLLLQNLAAATSTGNDPDSDLRRKSIMRRLSTAVARNSILIPNGASHSSLRRLSESHAILRAVSRMPSLEKSSPSVLKRSSASPSIVRRINRNRSVIETDPRRGRSNSLLPWVGTSASESLAPVFRPTPRASSSFGSGDRRRRPLNRVQSLPIAGSIFSGNSTGNDLSHVSEVAAGLAKRDRPTPVIKTSSLPSGICKGQIAGNQLNGVNRNLPNGCLGNIYATASATSSCSSTASSQNGSVVSFCSLAVSAQPTIPEEPAASSAAGALPAASSELPRPPSDESLPALEGYESDETGRQYDLLALPIFPPEDSSSDSSDSETDTDGSSDDLPSGGLGALFGLGSGASSASGCSSDESSSDDDDDRDSFDQQQDEMRSELQEIILSNLASDPAWKGAFTSV